MKCPRLEAKGMRASYGWFRFILFFRMPMF
jgi:hypothetical protein